MPYSDTRGEDTLQRKNNSTKARTEYYFDCPPVLAGEGVEIASKSDPGKQVGEEDVYGACKNELVENQPV